MPLVSAVYGAEHRLLKRKILALSFLDLIFIISSVVFVIIQLISVGRLFPDLWNPINDSNDTSVALSADHNNDEPVHMSLKSEQSDDEHDNSISLLGHDVTTAAARICNQSDANNEGCPDESTQDEDSFSYRTVAGARISLSIQLIIYLAQLGFGILLFIGTYHNDSRNLHMWVLFSEIVVVVIALNLFINFFGKFLWVSVIITVIYLLFKIVLIRMVRRFVHVNDLALTQFGSVHEF